MVNSKDVIRPNLSVREGIGKSRTLLSVSHLIVYLNMWNDATYMHCFAEIVVSGGMSMPQILSTLDPHTIHTDRSGASRS
jgi:hypothetical protein